MIKLTLPDNSVREYEDGILALDVAKSISEGLARSVVGAVYNGETIGLKDEVKADGTIKFLKFEDKEGKHVFWHTSSHIMAHAIKRIWPDAKLAIGPAIDNGFYYDIDMEYRLVQEDFEKIEAEMKKIVKEGLELERFELPREEAIKFMEERQEPYKVELIQDLPEDAVISFYKQGDFTDLCAGPHLESTKKPKAVKLLSIAGAYWRGSENNKMLQRVYGITFEKAKDLEDYLKMIEEAKKRDHRKLGKELDLFFMSEEGPGFPFFLPKGVEVKNELMKFWREMHKKAGYVEIETPLMLNRHLWETSGHWFTYKENMYTTVIDEQDFAIKPMNCPGGILVYKNAMHSYKDFPMRVAEAGRVHRHELSGALHGLMRVRAFTQDDAHLFILPEQIKDEIKGVIKLIDEIYKQFGFSYKLELSTRPEKFLGEIKDWDMAEASLKAALEELNLNFVINEGDGAFYGPKIDFHLTDCIGRTWQCGTIQLDYQLPQRFEMEYVGADGQKHRPVMIHRTAFGSIERFFGILIEQFAGAFPTWLAPVQVKVLPISDKYNEYAEKVKKQLEEKNIRVEVDLRAEKIGYKIREAQMGKVPFMFVVGEKEVENNGVSVRERKQGDMGSMSVDEIVSVILNKIASRENDSPQLA
ncbi:MAG: threonine--tRNA ligase [Sedimentibacter saalensis]|uniref:Threonine--tRNA ligase n=1 Tax=Sedimentibacter saalensis TaxID=130788 RepID=A0A562JHS1_9FIRM|nr:threonine--tRNA ligase [Sedimentibacter saalensis]MEA5094564.1 threonine--tRNA ligase [Sedimentibacter saalensis]TWH82760.1 threonyl-tRNA synthetase [Sedimentibacter saalensis]